MYDRLAQKVHSSTLVYCLYCKVPYSKGSGSHMPVAPDPPSEPQGVFADPPPPLSPPVFCVSFEVWVHDS